jgi:dipeptidyl aminopeptidase/acylaminoacyl peptidase
MRTNVAGIFRRAIPILTIALIFVSFAAAQSKRPLTHTDYDGWRNIQNQTLSRDGKFLAYGLFPQEGDGEVVVRNLVTGVEWKQPAGERPAPGRPNPESDEPPPVPNITITFTADSHFAVFSVFPARADVEKAKKEKRAAADMPKNSLVVMDLSSGKAVMIDRVRGFEVPEKGGDIVAYLHEPEVRPAGGRGNAASAPGEDADAGFADAYGVEMDQGRGGRGGGGQAAGGATGANGARKEYGSEMVLRNLETQAERNFPDVLSYTLTKDGALLAYAVSSHKEETNGIYAAATSGDAAPKTIVAGAGKYMRLTWDEDQTKLAFLSDHDDASAKHPKEKLYLWMRNGDAPTELVSDATAGFRDGCQVSDKGLVTFPPDGKRIFFGCAAAQPDADDPLADLPADDKVNADLWHWKDEHIQPMQKVRATQDRNRTYRCVYHLEEKKLVQLADASMAEVTPSENGLWAIGTDGVQYGPMAEYDTQYYDYYLVNTLTGERKPLTKKQNGNITLSPDAKHGLYFADKNWVSISLPDGKTTVLTANRGVNFWREDYDSPSPQPPYGIAGWTKDGKWLVLYDQYDVWRISGDGSEAVNITHGAGRAAHLEFRYVRMNTGERDPEARWIDPAQPLLLRAVDQDTYDTGFYRTRLDASGPPQKLIFAAKSFSTPLKARDADVVVTTASTFEEFPDLLVTDTNFSKLQKVSNANPQQAQVLWGTDELIHYRNADGVALKATLYKPENFDPKKKYPMIVYIYEKLTQNVHNYLPPRPSHTIVPTFYVSNGYLVLEPDIVYTIGEPGQSALKCVLSAVDAVVAQGFVNEKAIGIEGHSWGGYQIAYMVTQTNRFRAVEAGAPVVDMISAYDGIRWGPGIPRQFQYEHSQSRIGGSPWQTPLKYIENSSIFMADRVNTPMLILQNDMDDAVPWYQGIEYYLALRRLGKEVYMFTYNGEPHGLVRRPDQKDFTVRMQQYFDYFLKGAPKPDWMEKGIAYIDRDAEKERLKEKTGVY